ncbi:ATP-binding protein [Bittarella massiliensis (ex Durand et al. 2017)]|uniref:ATP-binding protein n=2 Tax=Clostridia TaxID=186801 RepID=UPI001AA12B69|nr:ATP-binding protein [Bittarella massiliensis (ex Durand et al. 2017)]MBO1678505.1 response regulator [Bittarella massiliensis (ex Durand et al. 2017)]
MKPQISMKKHNLFLAASVCVFLLLLGVFAALFIRNYQKLEESLAAERTVYISELSNQLVDKVDRTQDQYLHESRLYANLLNANQPDTFEEVRTMFAGGHEAAGVEVFLVDSRGTPYTLQGEKQPLENSEFLIQLLYGGEQLASFQRHSGGRESWIFGCPLEPLSIEGREFAAVLTAYDVRLFESSFALELFNQQGYSFIVDGNGAIVIGTQLRQKFGYNIFSSLKELGMEGDALQNIQQAVQERQSGQFYSSFDGAQWLLQYELLGNGEQYVFVLVPVSVTAALPMEYMRQTLTMAVLAILTLAMLFFTVMFFVFRSNRRRDAEVYQANLLVKSAEAKSDFLARMSHDIRTPLNGIIGMNYIASTHLEDREVVKGSLKKMDISANYLLGLINDVLDMQKIESGKLELNPSPFSARELLESKDALVRPGMEEKGLRFAVDGAEEFQWKYIGDQLRISQILMNLLSNANKFTPSGGTVSLLAKAEPMKNGKDRVTFTVEDSGVGMSQEYLQRLFQPFEQEHRETAAQYGGSGLGLSIVYNLVQLMQGEIRVQSKQGKGSRFEVALTLERGDPDVKEAEPAAPVEQVSLSGKRILLAEDNELNREIAEEILRMRGLEVVSAEDGKKALELLEGSEPGYFNAVITDIRMPVMDGYALAGAVRESAHPDGKFIPILAMSANAFDEDVRKSMSAGMDAHLKKPIVMEELEAALQTYLGSREG